MEGTRIVLVRHGESMNQVRQVFGGHAGCAGLSERGRQQVELLRDRLSASGELDGASALYASVMPRAVETAAIIAPALAGLDVVEECDFCEQHLGEGDGMGIDEFERRYPHPDRWSPDHRYDPGGETQREMGERVARGLDAIVERHAGETVVVACHGGVIVHSLWRWLGLEPGGDGRAWFHPANTSLTEWRFAPNPFRKATLGIQLVAFNDHAHLSTR